MGTTSISNYPASATVSSSFAAGVDLGQMVPVEGVKWGGRGGVKGEGVEKGDDDVSQNRSWSQQGQGEQIFSQQLGHLG